MRTVLMATLFVLAGATGAQSKTECTGFESVLFLGSCKPEPNRDRSDHRGTANEPSPDNDLPGRQPGNVPGGSPIAGTPTPTGGGTPGGGGGGPGGCTANCGPGGGGGPGLGNPGNDKAVGRAGEDPNGKGKGPTGSRGKNH